MPEVKAKGISDAPLALAENHQVTPKSNQFPSTSIFGEKMCFVFSKRP